MMGNTVRTDFIFEAKEGFREIDRLEKRLVSVNDSFNKLGSNSSFENFASKIDIVNRKISETHKSLGLIDRGINKPVSTPSIPRPTDTDRFRQPSDSLARQAEKDIARYQAQRQKWERDYTNFVTSETEKQYQTRVRSYQKGLSEFQRVLDRQRSLEQQLSNLPRRSGNDLFGAVLGGNLAAQAITQVSSAAFEGGRAILDYSSKLEQSKIGFETLLGSADKAQAHLRELQDFAKTTPFEFAELVPASQKLQGVGIQAQKVIPILTDVGNALAAAGKGNVELDRSLLAISQIIAKGKLSAQEVNQLAENGIPAWQILSKELGKSKAEVIALSEQGQISADIFLEAFSRFSQEKFGDAMQKQSRTFQGAMSNIKDSVLITSSTAFDPLYQKISGLAVDLADNVQRTNSFEQVGAEIAKSISKGIVVSGEYIVTSLSDYLSRRLGEILSEGKVIDEIPRKAIGGISEGLQKSKLLQGNPLASIPALFELLGNESPKSSTYEKFQFLNVGNIFGLDETIKVLRDVEAERQKELEKTFGSTADLNGVKVELDPITNTLRQVKETVGNTDSLSKKLEADKAARQAERLLDITNQITVSSINQRAEFQKAAALLGGAGDGSFSGIRRLAAIEDNSLREQIQAVNKLYSSKIKGLSEEDFTSGKADELRLQSSDAVSKLNTQRAILQLNTQKELNDSIEKGKEKVKEFERESLSALDNVFNRRYSQNPFFDLISEAQKASKEIEKLPENLRSAFQKMNSEHFSLKTFETRLTNNLQTNDLRREASNFRNPFDPEKLADEQDRFRQDFLRRNPNYLDKKRDEYDALERTSGYKNRLSFDDFINKDLEKRGENIFDTPKNRLNKQLEEDFSTIYRNRKTFTAEEAAAADRQFVSRTSGVNALDLSTSNREQAALAREREAMRRERYEQDAMKIYQQQRDLQIQIAANTAQQNKIAEAQGLKGVEVVIKNESDTTVTQKNIAKRPTAADTQNYYNPGLTFGQGGGLTNR